MKPSNAEEDLALENEAGEAYERVLRICRNGGGYNEILLECGRAAAEAYVASGGDAAYRLRGRDDGIVH